MMFVSIHCWRWRKYLFTCLKKHTLLCEFLKFSTNITPKSNTLDVLRAVRKQGQSTRSDGWQESYLLVVGGVSRQVGEVDKLHVEGPELGQDAAARRGPAPVAANATGGQSRRGKEWVLIVEAWHQSKNSKFYSCVLKWWGFYSGGKTFSDALKILINNNYCNEKFSRQVFFEKFGCIRGKQTKRNHFVVYCLRQNGKTKFL